MNKDWCRETQSEQACHAVARRPNTKANGRDRTDDLIITNDLLYQLSYVGTILNALNLQSNTLKSRQHLEQKQFQHQAHMCGRHVRETLSKLAERKSLRLLG